MQSICFPNGGLFSTPENLFSVDRVINTVIVYHTFIICDFITESLISVYREIKMPFMFAIKKHQTRIQIPIVS